MDIRYYAPASSDKVLCFSCRKFLCYRDDIIRNADWLRAGHRCSIGRGSYCLDQNSYVVCRGCYDSFVPFIPLLTSGDDIVIIPADPPARKVDKIS